MSPGARRDRSTVSGAGPQAQRRGSAGLSLARTALLCLLALQGFSRATSAGPPDRFPAGTDSSVPDSLTAPADSSGRITGLLHPERTGWEGMRRAADLLLFLPRQTVSGILYGSARGAYYITDPDVVERVEAVLYLYERRFGWYPSATIVSDARPAGGLGFFYRHGEASATLEGLYTDPLKWKSNLEGSVRFFPSGAAWKLSAKATIRADDDREWYGFGARPRQDPRNEFRLDEERGSFAQRRLRMAMVLGARPLENWEVLATSWVQQRDTWSLEGREGLAAVFSEPPPGFDSVFRSLYFEGALRHDSRAFREMISPGQLMEGYLGIARGVEADPRTFLRIGGEAALFLPLLQRNRILIPRIVANTVTNLTPERELPFTAYPRAPTFRGVSSRKLLRTDRFTTVPSLEYQWPLTTMVRASLFADALFAAPSPRDLTLDEAPLAWGFAVTAHSANATIGQLVVAMGTEGVRVKLAYGVPLRSNARLEWE